MAETIGRVCKYVIKLVCANCASEAATIGGVESMDESCEVCGEMSARLWKMRKRAPKE